jgi:uncharacterized protein YbjT (DUF2867 family)
MDKVKSLLLLGATGLIGGECLQYLRDDDYYSDVIILTRKILPETVFTAKIRQYLVDFDRIEQYRELVRADDVICALGSTRSKAGSRGNFYRIDFEYPYELAKIAIENGAGHFLLVSALGADPRSPFFYNRVKGDLENAIINLKYGNISIFRPSLLLGERKEFRPGEILMKAIFGFFSFVIPAQYRPIQARTVAAAILQAARKDLAGIHIFESDAIRRLGKDFRES